MKKAMFTLGIIGGILGILVGIALLIFGFSAKVTDPAGIPAIAFGIIGAIVSILGIIGASTNNKILLLIAFIGLLVSSFGVISGFDTAIYFVFNIISTILFLVAVILRFINKEVVQKSVL